MPSSRTVIAFRTGGLGTNLQLLLYTKGRLKTYIYIYICSVASVYKNQHLAVLAALGSPTLALDTRGF